MIPNSRSNWPAYSAFLALGVIWGSNFLFMKEAVAVITPLQVVLLRAIFGSLPILGLAAATGSLRWRDLRNSPHFIAMALFANVFPYYFFVKGTQLLPSGIAGVISGTIPLITALAVFLGLPGEKLDWRKSLGLGLGFVGVVLVVNPGSGSGTAQALGAGFMILGSVSYAIAMVYAKRFVTPLRLGSLPLAAYQTLFASLLLGLCTPTGGMGAIFADRYALAALVLGLGLLGTGAAFVFYYFIIERLGAITASSVYYIPPVVALLMGALARHEAVSRLQVFGTVAIVMGIYFARKAQTRIAGTGGKEGVGR